MVQTDEIRQTAWHGPYYVKKGDDPSAQRGPAESEIYGLKITQMLLPTTGHRIRHIAKFKSKYDSSAPLINKISLAH